jgi:ribosomal protein S13
MYPKQVELNEQNLQKLVATLKKTGTWRGSRLSRRLPLKGRTKTNSRTTRGNVRHTMGSGRAKTGDKT